jgi:heme iron utilization protein
MQDTEARLLRSLLLDTRVLSLAVLVDGAPLVGLLPFAARPDLSGAIVHASRLARHARGLAEGAPYGLLVHGPDAPDGDPLQVARLSLEGEVRVLAREHPGYPEADSLYRGRFPSSAPTFELGDFGLYELVFRRGRLVGGFARAINLDEDALRKVAER